MKNNNSSFPVEGTTALKSNTLENIIMFPAQSKSSDEDFTSYWEECDFFDDSLADTPKQSFFQNLMYGSVKGKAWGVAKPWQSWLVGLLFLGFALVCVFLAR